MNQDINHSTTNSDEEYINERTTLKRRCRGRLANHIKETTGITVEPTKVRLVTKQSDSYTWCCVKDVAHLFSKNLSDHGMAACKELYDGVGHSFHTVSFAGTNNSRFTELVGRSPTLQDAHNAPLKNQVLKNVNETECLQMELKEKQDECDRLSRQLAKESKRAELNESLLLKCLATLTQFTSLIERVRQECSDTMDFSVFID
ncbi:hypothetical protein B0J13DRAFT_270670 [Dactylonectria estremocensis]|uniref:Uncharacterized protein n=1 Tax=Dactylonectria estremocensis TaxID=1079267 RepID=A0A9P9D3C8_9HYPO|nr:hypothetical protein B0J13DRAFT_293558 [Dactylonectria estremocensis]KAH7111970.1 hypothetical protein B0J13DRAFT_270670 [Dactylonectria estremocensis]